VGGSCDKRASASLLLSGAGGEAKQAPSAGRSDSGYVKQSRTATGCRCRQVKADVTVRRSGLLSEGAKVVTH
jgi:hypothetical protein